MVWPRGLQKLCCFCNSFLTLYVAKYTWFSTDSMLSISSLSSIRFRSLSLFSNRPLDLFIAFPPPHSGRANSFCPPAVPLRPHPVAASGEQDLLSWLAKRVTPQFSHPFALASNSYHHPSPASVHHVSHCDVWAVPALPSTPFPFLTPVKFDV